MKRALILTALLSLAACGVDGEPTTPTKDASLKTGVVISGTAKTGITRRW